MRLVFRGLIVALCATCCGLSGLAGVAQAAAPAIGEQSAINVSATGATLQAQVNPEGTETTYRFEYDTSGYGSDATHGERAPSPEESIAASTNPASVEVHVQSLGPGTAYHFRVVATNAAHEVAYGADQTFTTPASGGEFTLPDGRAWEMVSPVDKHGARIEGITNEGGLIQAAEDGSAITYVADAPLVANPEGNPAIIESQIISKRGVGGWSTQDIATPHETAIYDPPLGHLAEYSFFSPDLSSGLLERYVAEEIPLSSFASEATIYLREGVREGGEGKYVPLVNDSNVPAGTHYGHKVAFVASTNNLEHVILRSEVPLAGISEGIARNPEGTGLYEWTAGVIEPVSLLPDGADPERPAFAELGDKNSNVRNAVSSNGQRVFWTYEGGGTPALYMRDMKEERTVQLNLPQGVTSPEDSGEEVRFQYATPDGTKVYFTDGQRLTPDATPEGVALYEYNTLTGVLIDLTPPLGSTTGSDVQGEVQVTSNGEYLYFVANGVLTPGAPVGDCAGESSPPGATCDLYVIHAEGQKITTSLVAVLSWEDEHDWEEEFGDPGGLRNIASRVSPDGRYLAFMSDRSLAGYDNTDETSGAPDEEVFLYDASTKRLACASCDPTGGRPHGVLDTLEAGEGLGLLVDRPQTWHHRWLAGSVPGWTGFSLSYAQYQSRYVSDNGRLFFDSSDSLVPQDTNGKEDVYEYEPEGDGCSGESQSASEVYERESGVGPAGCVALVSSGTSGSESAFLDASGKGPGGEEAEDAFFLTAAKLVPGDVDPAYDVYDGHVCSAQAPCESAPVSSPPCTTTDSCREAPAAQPSIFGAPSSATFSGAGNVVQRPSRTGVKSKVLTRAQKLVAGLRTCKTDKRKSKRARCEKQARKRYGAATKAKRSIKGRKQS